MRYVFAAAPLALLAGCGHQSPGNVADGVDINGVAQQAQGDIDSYAANTPQTSAPPTAEAAPLAQSPAARPSPAPSATPPGPGEPGGLPDDRTPVPEAPFPPGSAQEAANVVQSYYALIEAGHYRRAWALWGDGGKASGMSARAFAASFAKYAAYHANIGAPGRIDAGAGQRYVTVPVQVYGRLKAGNKSFNLRGDVTLHRTADIDGATPEQKSWHISAVDLKPTPRTTPPPLGPIDTGPGDGIPAVATADYRCNDGYAFHIVFDNRADTGTISRKGKKIAVLHAERAGSGIWYKGDGYELRGKGNQATFARPRAPAIACTAR